MTPSDQPDELPRPQRLEIQESIFEYCREAFQRTETNQRHNRQLFDYVEGKIMSQATTIRILQEEIVHLQQEKENMKVVMRRLEVCGEGYERLIQSLTSLTGHLAERLNSIMSILEEGQQEPEVVTQEETEPCWDEDALPVGRAFRI